MKRLTSKLLTVKTQPLFIYRNHTDPKGSNGRSQDPTLTIFTTTPAVIGNGGALQKGAKNL